MTLLHDELLKNVRTFSGDHGRSTWKARATSKPPESDCDHRKQPVGKQKQNAKAKAKYYIGRDRHGINGIAHRQGATCAARTVRPFKSIDPIVSVREKKVVLRRLHTQQGVAAKATQRLVLRTGLKLVAAVIIHTLMQHFIPYINNKG